MALYLKNFSLIESYLGASTCLQFYLPVGFFVNAISENAPVTASLHPMAIQLLNMAAKLCAPQTGSSAY